MNDNPKNNILMSENIRQLRCIFPTLRYYFSDYRSHYMFYNYEEWLKACRFTLKCVRDMIKTYSQMHRTD